MSAVNPYWPVYGCQNVACLGHGEDHSGPLLRISEVADLLGCSRGSVYALIAARSISTVDIGTGSTARTRVRESDLDKFIRARTTERLRPLNPGRPVPVVRGSRQRGSAGQRSAS